jgi:hypothetical protein
MPSLFSPDGTAQTGVGCDSEAVFLGRRVRRASLCDFLAGDLHLSLPQYSL